MSSLFIQGGTLLEQTFAISGSGSPFAMGYCDLHLRPGLDRWGAVRCCAVVYRSCGAALFLMLRQKSRLSSEDEENTRKKNAVDGVVKYNGCVLVLREVSQLLCKNKLALLKTSRCKARRRVLPCQRICRGHSPPPAPPPE